MARRMTWWVRIVRGADAIGVAKLLVGALIYWVLRGSPVYALGAAFAVPILLGAGAYLRRELYVAATGREPRPAPPARLGLPPSAGRPNEARGVGSRRKWVGH